MMARESDTEATRLDDSTREARRRLAQQPGDGETWRRSGLRFRGQGDFRQAAGHLYRGLATIERNNEIRLDAADTERMRGRIGRAIDLVRRALDEDPYDLRALRLMASLMLDVQAWGVAATACRKIVALVPVLAEAWHGLGQAARGLGLAVDSLGALMRVLAVNDAGKDGVFDLALACAAAGRDQEARRHSVAAIGAANWRDLPIIVNNRDRLAPLQRLLDWLAKAGHRNVVVLDNRSTFPPLLRYYENLKGIRIVNLNANLGHTALWRSESIRLLGIETPFVYTDPDILPDEGCPLDAVAHFCRIVLWYGADVKVGFGLRIDDIPDHYRHKPEVLAWESRYWRKDIEFRPDLYWSVIDTTFALYGPRSGYAVPGIRTGPPYVARHLSWYVDSSNPSEEEEYYRRHADPNIATWAGQELPRHFALKLGGRE
jgi:tetratricopeptide (TPR) repeat protein